MVNPASRTARDWETVFTAWAQPPGKTEQQRCENAESGIRKAIAASAKLKNREIKIVPHGSYRNRVNVRKESDVDIGVICYDSFYPVYSEGVDAKFFKHTDAPYQYSTFKNEVEEALVAYFGRAAVARGKKVFDVHETKSQVEADVAPFFEHRRYTSHSHYLSGVVLYPDSGGTIINWPEQHYDNGVRKNDATRRRFKGVVRILKSLRNEMNDAGQAAAKPITGFFIECLVWNVPNNCFGNRLWDEDVRAAIRHLWLSTQADGKCNDWGEVSELKYLLRGSPGKREQAHAFIDAAWNYIGVR